jgi:glucose/arabinose dehydrogenase
VCAALLVPSSAPAATLKSIGTFTEPMYVTSPPSEPNRILVVERSGRVVQMFGIHEYPFADLRPVVDCCVEDRGLQSIALAPNFARSGRFYLDYTDEAGNIEIAEMRAKGRTAPRSSLRVLLTIPYEPDANHYGGQLQFGPEDDLFISTGDGGIGFKNDEHHNAQDLGRLQGKLLRIDPLPAGALPYTVPPDNPFASAPAPFDTIWAYGLRNPYRFQIDTRSKRIAIPDVGEKEREEVDLLPLSASRGADFGWNCREGGIPGPATDPQCATPPAAGFAEPVFEYPHAQTGGAWGCAIIGGAIVADRSLGDLYGRYLYADFCTAAIRSFAPAHPAATDRSEGLQVGEVTGFGEDACGRVYVSSRGGGVSRFVGAHPNPCLLDAFVSISARSVSVRPGARAAISVRVAPCTGRRGEVVSLYSGPKRVGKSRLDRTCTARFHPRIQASSRFRAKVGADGTYRAAVSRRLLIRALGA